MEVQAHLIDGICANILAQSPAQGQITINDLFYEWEDFELLVCDIKPLLIVRPIPTLSDWGMIAIAVAMGVFGILYAVRKKASADS